MASYIESYRPSRTNLYSTDYQGILSGLQQKTDYWKVGVQQVQSAYEQAAGLQLTGDRNKQRLNQFMSQADEQLKKATASDVSMYDNMANAVSIYKPLYKDPELMADHQNTAFYKDQFNQIQNWRTKENGKYYSDTNAQDVMNSYMDFKNGLKSGQSAVDFVDKTRSYTPYYDYTKESLDLLSKCKPSSTSIMGATSGDAGLLNTKETEELSPAKVAGCLGSLSDKAKNQLMIDERVRYHNKPQELGYAWSSIGKQDLENTQSHLVQARLALTANQGDPKQKEYYTNLVKSYDDKVHQLESGLDAINKGDYSDIQNNSDQYAYQLGLFRHASQFSNAFSYKNESNEYTPNTSVLQQRRQNFEASQSDKAWMRQGIKDQVDFSQAQALQQNGFNNQLSLEMLKQHGKLLQGEELKMFLAGYGDIAQQERLPNFTTPATELKETEGLKLESDIANESKALIDNSTAAGNELFSYFNPNDPNKKDNYDDKLFHDLNIQDSKSLNPNMAKNRQGQIDNFRQVMANYERIKQQNSILPEGQKLANYKAASIDQLKEYVSNIERNESELALRNKINSIGQAEVNRQIEPETRKFNEALSKEKPITIQTANGQTVKITPQQVADLVQSGKSGGLLEVKNKTGSSNFTTPGSGSYQVSESTEYYYNGSKVIGLDYKIGTGTSPLLSLRNKIETQHTNYLKKKGEILNQVYGTAIAEGRNTYSLTEGLEATDAKKVNDVAQAEMERVLSGVVDPDKLKLMTIQGYLRDGRIVINTGKEQIDPNTLPVNNGQDVSTKTVNQIAFDIPALKQYTKSTPDKFGLRDNERNRQLQIMFEKNGKNGDFISLDEANVYRPSLQTYIPIRIYASKTTNGQTSYTIQKKDNNGWDNVPVPGYSNLSKQDADLKYKQYIYDLQTH